MFGDLTKHIQSLMSESDKISNQIENELEKLHNKRAMRIGELNDLQSTLPFLKKQYQSLLKAFGYSENDLDKNSVIEAKKAIMKAVSNYKRVEQSLREIEASIKALENEEIDTGN